MRRIFWLALGLGAGTTAALIASRWMRRQAEAMAPRNVAREARQTLGDVGQLFRESLEAGRQAMAQKESEVRSALEE